MFTQIGTYLVEVAAGFFVYLLLARFYFQLLRVPFRNPIGEFVIAVSGWMVTPARRVIPGVAGLDLASLVLAWLAQALGLWAVSAIRAVIPDPGMLAALATLELVRYSLHILVFAVIVQAVLSWTSPHTPLAPVFDALTRPFLAPIRRLVPPLGGVDLSPLVLLVALQVLFIPLAHLRLMIDGASF